jgi:hypothetical protein
MPDFTVERDGLERAHSGNVISFTKVPVDLRKAHLPYVDAGSRAYESAAARTRSWLQRAEVVWVLDGNENLAAGIDVSVGGEESVGSFAAANPPASLSVSSPLD